MSQTAPDGIEVFKYDDLEYEAQETALENFMDAQTGDPNLLDSVRTWAYEAGRCLGISFFGHNKNNSNWDKPLRWIRYDPGDNGGATIEGGYKFKKNARKLLTEIDLNTIDQREVQKIATRLSRLQRKYGYQLWANLHSHKDFGLTADLENGGGLGMRTEEDALEFIECMKAFCDWIHTMAIREQTYYTSETYAVDTFEDLGYAFTEDGEVYQEGFVWEDA